MQKDMYPIAKAQTKRLELMPDKLIEQCKNGAMALSQTVANNGASLDDVAEVIGKQRRVLSRAMKGSAGLPIDTLIKLMQESDSVYLLQYMCHRMGGRFVFESNEERELRDLKERVAQIEARRAA
jgi:hypothetical protein